MAELEKFKAGGKGALSTPSSSSSSSSSSVAGSKAWGFLKDRITSNLAGLQRELAGERRLRDGLSKGWAAARAEAAKVDDVALLATELDVPSPRKAPAAAAAAAAAASPLLPSVSPQTSELVYPAASGAVFYLVNLHEDEGLSGRWKVPLLTKLVVGRAPPEVEPVQRAAGARSLEVGTGGTDVADIHATLAAAPATGEVRLTPATGAGAGAGAGRVRACFANGLRVPAGGAVLSHGDRVIFGESASFVSIFVDLRAAAAAGAAPEAASTLQTPTAPSRTQKKASRRFSLLYNPAAAAVSSGSDDDDDDDDDDDLGALLRLASLKDMSGAAAAAAAVAPVPVLPSFGSRKSNDEDLVAEIDDVVAGAGWSFADALREMM